MFIELKENYYQKSILFMTESMQIKLGFKKTNRAIHSDLEIYDSINRIPFSLMIDYSGNRPTSVYCEILEGENFIEFWFDKETKRLYEITLVAIQENTVIKSGVDSELITDDLFECYIEDYSESNISSPIQTLRSKKSLHLFWGKPSLKTYAITKTCSLGVDEYNNLCSVSLVELNEELIYNILGF